MNYEDTREEKILHLNIIKLELMVKLTNKYQQFGNLLGSYLLQEATKTFHFR